MFCVIFVPKSMESDPLGDWDWDWGWFSGAGSIESSHNFMPASIRQYVHTGDIFIHV